MLAQLALRKVDFELPSRPNFQDRIERVSVHEEDFVPGRQVAAKHDGLGFKGFVRDGHRGVGTRNFVVVLGTSSLTASFARAVEAALVDDVVEFANVDGVVAVGHQEGGLPASMVDYDDLSEPASHLSHVYRTLAGYMIHPNVGAMLLVDHGDEVANNARLMAFVQDREEYVKRVESVMYETISIKNERFEEALERAVNIVKDVMLPEVRVADSFSVVDHAIRRIDMNEWIAHFPDCVSLNSVEGVMRFLVCRAIH